MRKEVAAIAAAAHDDEKMMRHGDKGLEEGENR